jgi:hypothetical protein
MTRDSKDPFIEAWKQHGFARQDLSNLQEQIYKPAFVFKRIRTPARYPGVAGMKTQAGGIAVQADDRHTTTAQRPRNGETGDMTIEYNRRWTRIRFKSVRQAVKKLALAVNHPQFSLID